MRVLLVVALCLALGLLAVDATTPRSQAKLTSIPGLVRSPRLASSLLRD